MWLVRTFKDRQDILVAGELALFVAAWALCIAAAIDDNHVRTNRNAENAMAANVDPTLPVPIEQHDEFE